MRSSTAKDELRSLVRRRALVFLEGIACALAALGLWRISESVQGATAEAQSVFLVVSLAFAMGFVRLVGGAIPVLAFRCPRCTGLFHADASRGAVRLRACAHCGMSLRTENVAEPEPRS